MGPFSRLVVDPTMAALLSQRKWELQPMMRMVMMIYNDNDDGYNIYNNNISINMVVYVRCKCLVLQETALLRLCVRRSYNLNTELELVYLLVYHWFKLTIILRVELVDR